MILGPSGQNIYPEEIEGKLNNMPFVSESIVIEKEGKLIALVYPDFENAGKENITQKNIETQMEENRIALNKELPAYVKSTSIMKSLKKHRNAVSKGIYTNKHNRHTFLS